MSEFQICGIVNEITYHSAGKIELSFVPEQNYSLKDSTLENNLAIFLSKDKKIANLLPYKKNLICIITAIKEIFQSGTFQFGRVEFVINDQIDADLGKENNPSVTDPKNKNDQSDKNIVFKSDDDNINSQNIYKYILVQLKVSK